MTLNDGIIQFIGIVITALATYGVAKLTRSGAKEANQTLGWTNLVTALQTEVKQLRNEEDDTRSHIKDLDTGNRDLARRVYVLERNRHSWKHWGRTVVEIMRVQGVIFPDPPEPLDDTDPGIERIKS